MTMVASLAIKDAFIFGSESREISADAEWIKDFQAGNFANKNFKVLPGEFPKTYLIGDRFALNYSGAGFTPDWHFEPVLAELQQMARSGGCCLLDLATHLNNHLRQALGDMLFGFHMAGFIDGTPALVSSNTGQLTFHAPTEQNPDMYFLYLTGATAVLESLFEKETPDFENMTVSKGIDFVRCILTAGCKFQEYFTRYSAVSGGPINILVVTPEKIKFLKFPEMEVCGI
jgi:hypothetical protein